MSEAEKTTSIKVGDNAIMAYEHPDAELIAACDAYCAAEAELGAFFSNGATPIDDDDARMAAQSPFQERKEELLKQLSKMKATTLEGFRALARAAATQEVYDPVLDGEYDEIVNCLVCNLLSEASLTSA